jgi:hypothetical protein
MKSHRKLQTYPLSFGEGLRVSDGFTYFRTWRVKNLGGMRLVAESVIIERGYANLLSPSFYSRHGRIM